MKKTSSKTLMIIFTKKKNFYDRLKTLTTKQDECSSSFIRFKFFIFFNLVRTKTSTWSPSASARTTPRSASTWCGLKKSRNTLLGQERKIKSWTFCRICAYYACFAPKDKHPFLLRKISNVAPPWGNWLRTTYWGTEKEEEKAQHPAGSEHITSRVLLRRGVVYCWATTTAQCAQRRP